ncbi:MAG: hypothetical protein NDI60_07060 [Elusimicrobiales bacterium]|nr:hypothetical protein [Elusimicrobiales bacterium]
MNFEKIAVSPMELTPWRRTALLALLLLSAASFGAPGLRAQSELGAEDDLTVLGDDGTAADPDVEVKGFSVFGTTQPVYPGPVQSGAGNVVINGHLTVSSGAYFTGISSFSDVTKTYVAGGVAGDVLAKNAITGALQWVPLSSVSGLAVSSAANLLGGVIGSLPYQIDTNATLMLPAGTPGYLLQTNGLAAPSWTNNPALVGTNFTGIPWAGVLKTGSSLGDLTTRSANDITSGTLALARGGTGSNLNATGGSNYVVRQNSVGAPFTVSALNDSDIPDTITIDGTNNVTWASVNKTGSSLAHLATRSAGDLNSGLLSSAYGGTGADLSAGQQGGVPWFAAAGVMGAVGTGPAGYFLKSNGTASPTWDAVFSVVVSSAANLAGGAPGSLPYQSASDTTSMLPAGTAGHILQTNGAAAPSWTNSPTLVGTNFSGIPWTGVFKAGSSLADLATRSASDLTSGTLALAYGGSGADLSATGGSNQIVRQDSLGGAFTVSVLADADIPDAITIDGTNNVTWASVNKAGSSLGHLETRSAGDLNSGILGSAYGGTGADLSGAAGGGVPYFASAGVMSTVGIGTSGHFLRSNGTGAPTWASVAAVAVSSAANLSGGAAGALPYQSAPDTTNMLAAGTAGHILQANGAAAPSWTNTPALVGTNFTSIPWAGVLKTGSSLADLETKSASDLTSGTLALARGGTGANLSAPGGSNQIVRQDSVGAAFTVSVLADADVPDDININGTDNVTWVSVNKTGSSLGHLATRSAGDLNSGILGSTYGGTGANLSAAAAGGVPYFSAVGVMGAVGVGTSGHFLRSNGNGPPTWASVAAVAVSSAANLTGGAAGSIPYQSSPDVTNMLAAGTAGYILQTNGAAAPSWTNAPALLGTNFTSIPWAGVLKTGSSLADLATKSAGDLTSGTLALARGGTGADLSATGGANFIVKQGAAGAAFTVSALSDAEVPDNITINGTNNVTWASVNKAGSSLGHLETRSAGDLNAGLLGSTYGGTGANLSAAAAGGVPYFSGVGVMGAVGAGTPGYYLRSNGAGAPTWASVSGVTVSSAANLSGGAAGSMPYQSSPNTTAWLAGGTAGYILQTNGAAAPSWTNAPTLLGTNFTSIPWAGVLKTGSSLADLETKSASDLTSGTLALARGGTGANLNATGGANQIVRQNTAGGAFTVSVLADADIPDTITINGTDNVTWASVNKTGSSLGHLATRSAGDLNSGLLGSTYGGTGANLSAAVAGGVPYFSGVGVMSALGAGTAGYYLRSNGAGAPTWASVAGVTVSSAANLSGGAAGSVPYQSSPNTTAFLAGGTAGYLLQTNGAAAPSWTNMPTLDGTNFTNIPWAGVLKTGSSLAHLATRSAGDLNSGLLGSTYGGTGANLSAAAAGGVPYFSGVGVMSALGAGTAGYYLRSNGAGAPTWASVSGVTVSSAANLSGGAAGSMPYQSAPNTTAFVGAGTANYILQANGAAAPSWTNTPTLLGTNITAIPWANVTKTGSSIGDLANKSHTLLSDIGTNTHAQLDTHLGLTYTAHGAVTTATGDTLVARNASGDITGRYLIGSYTSMSHASASRATDTIFYSSTDNYIRKNDAAGFRASLDVPTRTGGDASGTWAISITGTAAGGAGSAAYSTITGIPVRTAWVGVHRNFVAEQLSWKNYGNGHTIFDASAGTSPDGGAVNNTNPGVAWAATYPTLMGWNGSNTYGVRVDRAGTADTSYYAP